MFHSFKKHFIMNLILSFYIDGERISDLNELIPVSLYFNTGLKGNIELYSFLAWQMGGDLARYVTELPICV